MSQFDDLADAAGATRLASRLQQAFAKHRAGALDETEELCREILAADARHSDAWHLLGLR